MFGDYIAEQAPCVFNEKPSAEVSKHYTRIPTSKVINDMRTLGWDVVDAKEVKARKNSTKGTQYGHAYYDSWKESLADYALWYSTFAYKCKNESQLYTLLNKQYAEANYYPQALKRIIKKQQLKLKFKK